MLILRGKTDGLKREERRITRGVQTATQLMNRVAARLLTAAEDNIRAGGRPRWPPSRRASRRGRPTLLGRGTLLRSLQKDHGSNYARVFTRLKYARIHQFGGTIHARPGKALAIPLERRFEDVSPLRIKTLGKTFILHRDGRAVLMLRVPEKDKPIAAYLLLKSVTLPARPFIAPPEGVKREIDRLIADWVTGRDKG